MHPELVKLLDVQAKDLALREVDLRLDAVLAEGEALDQAVRKGKEGADLARRVAVEAAKRRDELEAKIESYRKMQERRRLKLETVRGAKEATVAMAEIDLARSVLAKEEGDWVRLADSVTAMEAAATLAESAVVELHETQIPLRAAVAERRAALESERAAALQAREAVAVRVEKTLRQRYDRLRTSRSPTVVVPLAGAACSACYTTVPLNRRSQIRAGALIDWCEACGVLLYASEDTE